MVMGLVSQTKPTESGTLHRKTSAKTAAATICSGIGIQAQNRPFKKANATDRRFKMPQVIREKLPSDPTPTTHMSNLFRWGHESRNKFLRHALLVCVFDLDGNQHKEMVGSSQ